MDLIGAADWADYQSLIGVDALDTFAQATIVWRRQITNVDRWKEDNVEGQTQDITLRCLVNYNYMRSWPITNMTESGEIEQQSIQVLFFKDYLNGLGYVNNNGLFIYKPDYDRFVLDGLIRKPVGDSSVSQAKYGALLFEVIMVEQRTLTGQMRQ